MLGGGPITRSGAVFSADGQSLYVPALDKVRKHSSATGELYGSLQGGAHEVRCILRHPTAKLQVVCGSADGTISVWIPSEDLLARSFNIGHGIADMVATPSGNLVVSILWRNGESGRVKVVSLETGEYVDEMGQLKCATPLTSLAASSSGATAATFENRRVFVWQTDTPIQPLTLHHTKAFTCVAIDSHDDIVAAGDATGRILIWRNMGGLLGTLREGGAVREPACTTLHWHAFPVGCLAFSPDSTFLYSGGQEGVLVQWQLDSNRNNFLPRLGGPLVGLVGNPAELAQVCVVQADNTLRVIDTSNFKVVSSIHGIRPRLRRRQHPKALPWQCAGPVAQPRSSLLVVPADHTTLQFYDLQHDSHVAKLPVVARNPLPAARGSSQRPPEPTVAHVAFSGCGGTLVTVDTQPEVGLPGADSVALKFWERSPEGSISGRAPYVVNTQVDNPHRAAITGLAVHPTEQLVVTTGGDEFRVWVRTASAPRPGSTSTSYWRCRSAGSYKGLPLTGCAISADGTLLAVACQDLVTLWALPATSLCTVLRSPLAEPAGGGSAAPAHIKHMAFVPDTPFMVVVMEEGGRTVLLSWNLLTTSVWWSAELPVTHLAVDSSGGRFAVALASQQQQRQAAEAASRQQQQQQQQRKGQRDAQAVQPPVDADSELAKATSGLLAFTPDSPQPKFSGSLLGWEAAGLLFTRPSANGGSGSGSLLLLNDHHQYAFFSIAGDEVEAPATPATQEQRGQALEASTAAPTTADVAHLLHGSNASRAAAELDAPYAGAPASLLDLFDAPSHALPPPSQLCTAFLESMLVSSS